MPAEVADRTGRATPTGAEQWARRHGVMLATVASTLVAVSATLALAPVGEHYFSGSLYMSRCLGSPNVTCYGPMVPVVTYSFPSGTPVQITWNSVTGPSVEFSVYLWTGHGVQSSLACAGVGPHGTCRFTAEDGSYQLIFAPPYRGWTTFQVAYFGTYPAPLR